MSTVKELLWCAETNRWHLYDGGVFRVADDAEVFRQVKLASGALRDRVLKIVGADPDPALADALAVKTTREILKTVAGMKVSPENAVTPADLDANPNILGVANGTLDLTTGALRPISMDDRLSRSTSVGWDASADAPHWEELLYALGSARRRDAFRALLRNALLGTDGYRIAVVRGLDLDQRNELVRIMREVFGTYADSIPWDMLANSSADRLPVAVGRLPVSRLALVTLPVGSDSLAKATSQLADARSLLRRFLDGRLAAQPHPCKLWILPVGNEALPVFDDVVASQIDVVDFRHRIEFAESDKVSQELSAELPGILRWIVGPQKVWW